MIIPAVALFAVRRAAGRRVEPRLRRMEAWLSRHTGGATAWIVGIIGFFLAVNAIGTLIQR